ncbi:MAG: ComEA family DNA-binding protein [Sphingobacteriaceae bacterium]
MAQTDLEPEILDIIESLEKNPDEAVDYSELVERLTFFKSHPLNINTANADEWKELGLLSPLQINSLLIHRSENGQLLDILELQAVENFDLKTITLLIPFIKIGSDQPFKGLSFGKLISGKHDVLIRFQQVLQKQEGYRFSGSDQTAYLGNPQKILFRYRYQYHEHLSASLNLEKDPGELLFRGQPMGFDFGSGYLAVKNVGHLHQLVLGDYDLQFGQGLALWSGLSFGKSAQINAIAKQDVGLKPYSSFNEGLFFRGVAASFKWQAFDFTPFYSSRKLDASITDDMQVSTLNISGFHRTANEIANERNLAQQVYGGHLKWECRNLNFGFTAAHTHFDRFFEPGKYPYNQFEFAGKQLNNYAFNYDYSFHNTYFFGEFAQSSGSKHALITGFISSLSPRIAFGLLYRNYPPNYHSFYNTALSEASTAVNESGFYAGLTVKPTAQWEWSMYADVFRFPWLKFGVDAPSAGFELLSQLVYKPNKRFQLMGLYRFTQKEENDDLDYTINHLVPIKHQKARIDLSYWVNTSIQVRNRLEMVKFQSERGYLLYQDFVYKPLQSKFSGNFRFAVFNIPSYNARIYAYQNDVLYSYSIFAYQNRGVQFYFNGRYSLLKGLDCWLNYASQRYINLENLGSGLSEIEGNKRSEIKLQIRYQF